MGPREMQDITMTIGNTVEEELKKLAPDALFVLICADGTMIRHSIGVTSNSSDPSYVGGILLSMAKDMVSDNPQGTMTMAPKNIVKS